MIELVVLWFSFHFPCTNERKVYSGQKSLSLSSPSPPSSRMQDFFLGGFFIIILSISGKAGEFR